MDSLLLNDLYRSKEYRVQLDWAAVNIYIYGTGSFARDVKNVLQQNNIHILGFIDHKKTEQGNIDGLPVYWPDKTHISSDQRKNSLVILGIHNRDANIPMIIQTLKQLEYGRIISPIDLYDDFAVELTDRYWLTSRTYYSSHISEIKAVYEMFSDGVSRDTFTSLLRFRIKGDYSLLPKPDFQYQYLPGDLPSWIEPIRFVDCGAYNGDTLRSFLATGHKFQEIVAFEPDPDNFRELSRYVTQNRSIFPNATLFPCGTYSSTEQLKFDTGRGEATAASQTGASTIQCVALDDCIPTFKPTLIKMDIEGLEVQAVNGATKIIGESQPALAISIYHVPEYIWEVPLLIEKIARENHIEYSYHMRAHAHNCYDTIFYAIPVR